MNPLFIDLEKEKKISIEKHYDSDRFVGHEKCDPAYICLSITITEGGQIKWEPPSVRGIAVRVSWPTSSGMANRLLPGLNCIHRAASVLKVAEHKCLPA